MAAILSTNQQYAALQSNLRKASKNLHSVIGEMEKAMPDPELRKKNADYMGAIGMQKQLRNRTERLNQYLRNPSPGDGQIAVHGANQILRDATKLTEGLKKIV
jgi:uncharacterized membrane protein YdfJ with MMPL/SSD domain